MMPFTLKQSNTIKHALNKLHAYELIEHFDIQDDYAEVTFDDFRVLIECPMDGAYQFQLRDGGDNLVAAIVTDKVRHSLPIQRVITALFGKAQLEAFQNEWDGYTYTEGNTER